MEKSSIVSMNCRKVREGGNVTRMITQFLFLKSCPCGCISSKPNVLCPVRLKRTLFGLVIHGKTKKDFSLTCRRSSRKVGGIDSADVSSKNDSTDL